MNIYYLFSEQASVSSDSYLTVPAKMGADIEIWIYSRSGRLISHSEGKSQSDKYVCLCSDKNKADSASIVVVHIGDENFVYKTKKAWVNQAFLVLYACFAGKLCIKADSK